MSKQPPSWISKFFQNVRKSLKITEKNSKPIERYKNDQKVKVAVFKLFLINKDTKIPNLEKHTVKMQLPWQHQVLDTATCNIQFFPNKFEINSQSLAEF